MALGVAYNAMGDFQQALDASRRVMMSLTSELRSARVGQSLPQSTPATLRYYALPAVVSRAHIARSLAELGGFVEGRGVGEEAVRLAEPAEQPYKIAIALPWGGLLSRRQGALQRAIPTLERGLALCQTADFPLVFSVFASILSVEYTLVGRIAEALSLLDQTREHVATENPILLHALVLTELSEALLLVGRADEASTLATHLLDLSRTHTGRGYQAHCHLGPGTLYHQVGCVEQARWALSTALDCYRAMDITF